MRLDIKKYGFKPIYTSSDVGDWYGEIKDEMNGVTYYISICGGANGFYSQVSMGMKYDTENHDIFKRYFVRSQKQLDFLMWSNRFSHRFNKKKTLREKLEDWYTMKFK